MLGEHSPQHTHAQKLIFEYCSKQIFIFLNLSQYGPGLILNVTPVSGTSDAGIFCHISGTKCEHKFEVNYVLVIRVTVHTVKLK